MDQNRHKISPEQYFANEKLLPKDHYENIE